MSLNLNYAMDTAKVSKVYGELFGTIDFEPNDNLTQTEFKTNGMKTSLGLLKIGNREYTVNMHDLRRLEETVQAAIEVTYKKYKLGRMR